MSWPLATIAGHWFGILKKLSGKAGLLLVEGKDSKYSIAGGILDFPELDELLI